MRNEGIPTPETKSEKLLAVLPTIAWENYTHFEFDGLEYILFVSTKEEIEANPESYGEAAEYSKSFEVSGYDIYLHDTIPEANRPRTLFHEIYEASLVHEGMDSKDAHVIALEEENKAFGERTS